MKRAYYSSSLEEFVQQDPAKILGEMTRVHGFDLTPFQRNAWIEQTTILQDVLAQYPGRVYFEFSIPRMGRRIDAVIIIQSVIFVIEFKVGASEYEASDLDQVMDYALDLHNFHEGSHKATLVPILVATKAPTQKIDVQVAPEAQLLSPLCCNRDTLGDAILAVLGWKTGSPIDSDEWEQSCYKPTPTIIEATLALYNGHSVEDISRSDACAQNLSHTSSSIAEIIKASRQDGEKSIVLVTGVPGAGKTLVGLNIATTHISPDDELYSVFLSGNGPLVKILQEALARDKVAQGKSRVTRHLLL